MSDWDWMRPVNEGQPKLKNGTELSEPRKRIVIVSGPAHAWDCPYMRCCWKLRVPASEYRRDPEAERDAHLAERHRKVVGK